MIFGFFLFSISLLPIMSYMTLSSQEKPLFQKIIPSRHLLCNSVRAFASIPQTLLLKIFWERMHGPSPPTQILGDRPPKFSARESITLIILKMCVSLVGYMLLSLFYKLFLNN